MDNTLSLPTLFNQRLFRIPDYQRGYAWEKGQVADLLEDLSLLNPPRRHYAGTIVLCQLPDEPVKMGIDGTHYAMHAVVDGQQRLTTIVLLLNELSRALEAYPDFADLAQGIRKNYVETKSLDNWPIYKLSLNGKADDFFRASILPETPGVEEPRLRAAVRLRDAKKQIADYLRRGDESEEEHRQLLTAWHGKLTQLLHFNLYEVEKEAEVGIIFEVMNDRGKPLTELEKVKNYLLYASRSLDVAESASDELGEKVNDAWGVILENLMDAGLGSRGYEDQLLQMHWIKQYDPQAKNWDGVKSVKGKFGLRRYAGRHADLLIALREYVEDLRASSVVFCDARNPRWPGAFGAFGAFPDGVRNDLRYWSAKLARIGVIRTFLPLLMAARQRWPSEPERYIELVKLCEAFAFRIYRIWGARSNYRESAMFHLAYEVAHGMEFGEAVLEIKRAYGSREARRYFGEFTNAADPSPDYGYGWSALGYFLYEYEEHLAPKGASPKISWQEVARAGLKDTIEHVLPQYIGRQPYWQERFASEHEEYVHDMGNLTLTKWNSYYSDKPFPEKKGEFGSEAKCYAEAPFYQERELALQDDWTKESINARRAKLLAWAAERWSVDFSDVDGAGAQDVEPDEDQQDDEVDEAEEGAGEA